jgi:transposase
MSSVPEIAVQNLDHLGLVAGLIDEIGIVEHINQLVGEKPGEIVSRGHAVKAMILNGLGLVSAPLYLFSQFFEGKATEYLIGEGIQPKHLNDDRLGRVLDKSYITGTSQIFTLVALAAGRFILATNVLDIDQLSCDEMIAKYKEQQSSERGFAFLKDPLFFTDSVFLKSPERIEALALVMGLCLLVYTLGQRYLRSRLQQSHSTACPQP